MRGKRGAETRRKGILPSLGLTPRRRHSLRLIPSREANASLIASSISPSLHLSISPSLHLSISPPHGDNSTQTRRPPTMSNVRSNSLFHSSDISDILDIQRPKTSMALLIYSSNLLNSGNSSFWPNIFRNPFECHTTFDSMSNHGRSHHSRTRRDP